VLELLQAGYTPPPAAFIGRKKPQARGLAFSEASAAVRLVCGAWKTVHDARVSRLVLRRGTTDEGMGMLARRFPAVVSVEFNWDPRGNALTDEGMRAVASLTSITSLNLNFCRRVTDEGLLAVSRLPALKSLNLGVCKKVTNAGLLAVSRLPALTSLDLGECKKVTDEGLRAVSGCTALTALNISYCKKVTDAGLRAVSCLPALTSLNLSDCRKVRP
jgi:hypothetical protein